MTHPEPRAGAQRKADTLALLCKPALDGWVASADASGRAHLVPLSVLWTDERIVLALAATSLTARNLVTSGAARIGLGDTRDVVMIDAVFEEAVPVAQAPARIADRYAEQTDWDPRDSGEGYVYLVLRPERIQAWRESNEIAGRTLFRAGGWTV